MHREFHSKNNSHTRNSFLPNLQKQLLDEKAHGNELILAANLGEVCVGNPKIGGKDIFNKIKTAIEEAKSEVLYAAYKLQGNCDGEKDILEALEKLNEKAHKENRKIRVRFLINRREGLAKLFRPNVPNRNVFQMGKQFNYLDFQYVEYRHTGFGSLHSKILIVDNEAALLPTCDLTTMDNYKDGTRRSVNLASLLYGKEFIQHLRKDFIHAWNSRQAIPLVGVKKSIPIDFEDKAESKEIPLTPALFISKKANGNLMSRSHLSPFTISLLSAIKQAQKTIHIITPNFNIPEVIDALVSANLRGVEINIVMDKELNDPSEKKPFMGGSNLKNVTKLFNKIKAAHSPYQDRLKIRWTTDHSGNNVIPYPHENTLHARVACVDDIVFLGSSVIDKQSAYHSRECDVILQSQDVSDLFFDKLVKPNFDKGRDVFTPHVQEIELVSLAPKFRR